MPKFIFTNVIGSFVFDENLRVIEERLFKDADEYKNKAQHETQLIQKYKNITVPEGKNLHNILLFFKNKKYFSVFSGKNLELAKKAIKDSVSNDSLIIQTISSIEEIDKTLNLLVKRLREWYSLYNPEASYRISDHEKFALLVATNSKSQLLKELKIDEKGSIGAELKDKDISAINSLASEINSLFNIRKNYENYLSELETEACPNLKEILGITLAAKIIEHAGSLKRLMEMPASTIQILGAEKALFRHLRNKRNLPPKHGILREHQLIQKSKKELHGKAARALADKSSIAVKIDYFKGKFIGDKLKKALVDKFKIQY